MKTKFKYLFFVLVLMTCISLVVALRHIHQSSKSSFTMRLGDKQTLYSYPKDLNKQALLLYFISVRCPEGRKNIPKIKEFFLKYSQVLDVIFVIADPNYQTSDVEQMIRDFQIDLSWTHDKDLRLSKQLGAQVSSQVMLFDKNKLIYSGRIDDQYQIGIDLPAPREENLKLAFEQFLNKKVVDPKETLPFGCALY